MKKYLVLIGWVFLCSTCILFAGCNDSGKNNNENPGTVENKATATVDTPAASAELISGVLDTLLVSAADFKKLTKNKATFVFYFASNDTITLHGWEYKGGGVEYSNDPDIQLTKGNPSLIAYSSGTYFGNLSLNNVNGIIKMINDSAATKVMFVPQPLYHNHVVYKVYLGKGLHTLFPSGNAIIPTNEEANPSPPKNS